MGAACEVRPSACVFLSPDIRWMILFNIRRGSHLMHTRVSNICQSFSNKGFSRAPLMKSKNGIIGTVESGLWWNNRSSKSNPICVDRIARKLQNLRSRSIAVDNSRKVYQRMHYMYVSQNELTLFKIFVHQIAGRKNTSVPLFEKVQDGC